MADRARASGRPTLDDVAAVAGVSRMVASRALNGQGNVSAAASEKVHAAVAMLGYVPHQGARSLATNRTSAIAFLAPMDNDRFFGDPNVALIVSGLKHELAASGNQLVTLLVEDAEDSRRVGRFLQARPVDGVVILSPELVGPLVRDLQRFGLPIAGNGRVDGADAMDSLVFDARAAARAMASRLQEGGARRPAVVAGPADRTGTQDVLQGIRDVFGVLGDDRIRYTDHSFRSGQEATVSLLRDGVEFDGLFVSSDAMASAAIAVLDAAGIRVPSDVRVTGWDNSLPADAVDPPLTTLDIPYRSIGERLGRMLVEQLAGEPGGRVESISTAVVGRRSA
jgi:DNA-binding LacI/PurR family transcriptional regulator